VKIVRVSNTLFDHFPINMAVSVHKRSVYINIIIYRLKDRNHFLADLKDSHLLSNLQYNIDEHD